MFPPILSLPKQAFGKALQAGFVKQASRKAGFAKQASQCLKFHLLALLPRRYRPGNSAFIGEMYRLIVSVYYRALSVLENAVVLAVNVVSPLGIIVVVLQISDTAATEYSIVLINNVEYLL